MATHKPNTAYLEHNHPTAESLNISTCYLCGKALEEPINSDHIIPDSLFPVGAGHRPQLPVHVHCNSKKTKLDKRFKLRIQMTSQAHSPLAEADFSNFLADLAADREDAYIVGKHPKNLMLAKTLTKGAYSQTHMVKNGKHLVKVQVGQQHIDDILTYSKTMTRGLLLRNIPTAAIGEPQLRFFDPHISSDSDWNNQKATFEKIYDAAVAQDCYFMQLWQGHIFYFGVRPDSTKESYAIWVQFYNSLIVMATFNFESLSQSSQTVA